MAGESLVGPDRMVKAVWAGQGGTSERVGVGRFSSSLFMRHVVGSLDATTRSIKAKIAGKQASKQANKRNHAPFPMLHP
jgi:hypothetical protein